MISLIHPSRSRAQKSLSTIKDTFEKTAKITDIEIIISIDSDDPEKELYYELYSPIRWFDWRIECKDNKTSVEAINWAAKKAKGDILFVLSDDTRCSRLWDQQVRTITEGKKKWILKTQDGIQPWIITNPILHIDYAAQFGYVYYPGYDHLFADTELTCVADITGNKMVSNIEILHDHYSIGKATLDSVYSKNDRTNEQGEKLFLERYARNFDLPKGNPIQDKGLISWLKSRHVNA